MLAVVKSVGLQGLDGYLIDVEVDVSGGLPDFTIVGLPDTAVREAKERVRAAIKNAGFDFPTGRITVNLAPADLRKEGPAFDMAIAVGLLAASGQIKEHANNYVFLGELSLDGSIRSISGVLPSVLVAKAKGPLKGVLVPAENGDEAALVNGLDIYKISGLRQAAELLNQEKAFQPHSFDLKSLIKEEKDNREDMGDIKGQYRARRALEIAAAGAHNLLMSGPPGSGKTMLARRLATILPKPSFEEALEVTKIYSVSGLLKSGVPLITERPFRSPHHNISRSGAIGGGSFPKPGEISLSHHGVLFLDELPEFRKDVLESLRQPLEGGTVSISRANGTVEYPAEVMLVGAMNPCPCGYFGDETRECTCTPYQIQRYRGRISGPLLDRIDIVIDVPRVGYKDINDNCQPENSQTILQRVETARQIQYKRFRGTDILVNGKMGSREVREFCQVSGRTAELLRGAFEKLRLSARAYNKILKVARTIADLEGALQIKEKHLAEAIQYRDTDRFSVINGSTMLC